MLELSVNHLLGLHPDEVSMNLPRDALPRQHPAATGWACVIGGTPPNQIIET